MMALSPSADLLGLCGRKSYLILPMDQWMDVTVAPQTGPVLPELPGKFSILSSECDDLVHGMFHTKE